ncbi:hypothetical protein ACFVTX_14885 [Agromyces sp. NPDC058136]|uniref:hypothetical protein n=1 Tax=Agromyces sp. NPDC058136 TaxID=3346354 RepID=UPI0036DBEF30
MSLYLVRTRGRADELWLAYEASEGVLYVYVPNTGKFHRNSSLSRDFYVDQELSYEPIAAEFALRIIAAGRVGRLDSRSNAQLVGYATDPNALDPTVLLA